MTEQLKPGWRWENFDYLRSTVVTAPNGMEYELRAGDIAHPRAQRLFDAMFAALTTSQPAQAGEVDERVAFCIYPKCLTTGRTCAGDCSKVPTQPAAQAGEQWTETAAALNYYAHNGNWPTQPAAQATPEPCVTRLSAVEAISHAYLNGGPGGLTQANALLRSAATPPQQAAGEPVGEHVATVAEVHMSRYTLEWNGKPYPEGTKLFTRPAPGVPEGFALVPVKATPKVAMVIYEGARNCFSPKVAEGLWQDALAAAQAKGADPEDLAAAGVMLMGRRTDHA